MSGWPSDKPASPWLEAQERVIEALSDDELILEWKNKKLQAAKLVLAEVQLRNEIIKRKFPDQSDGTKNFELGKGWKLKAVFKTNYSPDDDKVDETLDNMRKAGPEGVLLAARIFSFKASLKLSEYKQLPEVFRKMIDAIITTKPAQASLELVSPDDTKKKR